MPFRLRQPGQSDAIPCHEPDPARIAARPDRRAAAERLRWQDASRHGVCAEHSGQLRHDPAAEKDGQFDLNGATLSEEDVKGHLRYLRDQNKPAQSIFLKRDGKQKVTERHIQGLARIGLELKVHTYLQEKPGMEITEVRTESSAK